MKVMTIMDNTLTMIMMTMMIIWRNPIMMMIKNKCSLLTQDFIWLEQAIGFIKVLENNKILRPAEVIADGVEDVAID